MFKYHTIKLLGSVSGKKVMVDNLEDDNDENKGSGKDGTERQNCKNEGEGPLQISHSGSSLNFFAPHDVTY